MKNGVIRTATNFAWSAIFCVIAIVLQSNTVNSIKLQFSQAECCTMYIVQCGPKSSLTLFNILQR